MVHILHQTSHELEEDERLDAAAACGSAIEYSVHHAILHLCLSISTYFHQTFSRICALIGRKPTCLHELSTSLRLSAIADNPRDIVQASHFLLPRTIIIIYAVEMWLKI